MITKAAPLQSMKLETHIIKHPAYRPSESQRSMLELLQYPAGFAIGPAVNTVTGYWDHPIDGPAWICRGSIKRIKSDESFASKRYTTFEEYLWLKSDYPNPKIRPHKMY